jgi:uncharacterized cupin superfamily protein
MIEHLLRFDPAAITPERGAPPPERVLAGSPRFTTWNLEETPDGKVFSGIWEATPGKWRVAYDEWEFCSILSGRSIVQADGGTPQTFGPGDHLVIRPGFAGTWEVVETTRKVYVIRLP